MADAEITEERICDLFVALVGFKSKNPDQDPKPEDIGATLEEFYELALALKNTSDLYYNFGMG